MLTIEDIRNPARQSGFDHVNSGRGGSGDGANRSERWRASCNVKDGGHADHSGYKKWRGPLRGAPELAAQDYCDYRNGQVGSAALLPSYADVKIDMGNTKRHAPKAEKVEVKREKFVGPHDVYDVLFVSSRGHIVARKVGITARGHARYADVCKTLGMSVRPHAKATTFPSEEAARVAEAAKIAEVCKDSAWKRIAKEAFEPKEAA